MGKKLIAFSLFVQILFQSCFFQESFSRTEQVKILMPTWPPAEGVEYPPLSGWHFSFYGKYGQETRFIPVTEEPPSPLTFSLEVRKDDFLGFSARPVTLSSDRSFETMFFMPAGTLYPQLCEGDKLQLTWEDGFAAKIVQETFTNGSENGQDPIKTGDYLSHFNWRRFSSEISRLSSTEDSFYNPWHLDFRKTVRSITGKDFSLQKIKLSPTCTLETAAFNTESPLFLSPYIPENLHIIEKGEVPCYFPGENSFFIEGDRLLIINSEDSKKISETTVFMPKKMDRDSLCKNEFSVF